MAPPPRREPYFRFPHTTSPRNQQVVTLFTQVRYQPDNHPGGTSRAAQSDKNLNQVLKNMDSLRQKSTVQTSPLHFVSNSRRAQAFRSKRPLVLMTGINKSLSRHNSMSPGMLSRVKCCANDDGHGDNSRNRPIQDGSTVAGVRRRCYTVTRGVGGRNATATDAARRMDRATEER